MGSADIPIVWKFAALHVRRHTNRIAGIFQTGKARLCHKRIHEEVWMHGMDFFLVFHCWFPRSLMDKVLAIVWMKSFFKLIIGMFHPLQGK